MNENNKCLEVKRGEVYWVDFSPARGSEQEGKRPALIVQNDTGNRYAPTTIVCAITSRVAEKKYPVNVRLPAGVLPKKSEVLCGQIYTIDKSRLAGFITELDESQMQKVNGALKVSLGLR